MIPLDLLFSLWVFVILSKVEQVTCTHLGDDTMAWRYVEVQAFGALVTLVFLVMWLDRGYLKAILRNALFGRGPLGDEREALGNRVALLGLAGGIAYLWWFLRYMGMTVVAGTALLAVFLLIWFALARFRAQLGSPYHEIYFGSSMKLMRALLGPSAFDARTDSAYSLMDPILWNQNNNPSPYTIDALKMGEGQGTLRGLTFAIMLAAVVGSLSYFWATLHVVYPEGATILTYGHTPPVAAAIEHANLDSRLSETVLGRGDLDRLIPFSIGAGSCILLMLLKLRFPGFPLHPVALPIVNGVGTETAVAAAFIAWIIKVLVLRWGGQRAYGTSRQLALGVLLGSAVAGATLSLLREMLGLSYRTQP